MKIKAFCSEDLKELDLGDLVSYKKNGVRGSFRAIVTGIGLKRVGIKIYSHDGIRINPEIHTNVNPKNLRFVP